VSIDEALKRFDEGELLSLISRLVAVRSEYGQEREVMEVAAAYLEGQGVRVELWARNPQSPNLVAAVGSGYPVVAMNGHLDTVPVSDARAWKTNPLVSTIEGHRLYGLGALDMKGSCAVMMLVTAMMGRQHHQLKGTLQLQLVSDEEASGYLGTDYLVELMKDGKIARPNMVLNGEYTGLKLMNAERGSFKFHVTFRGKPTHTATARVDGVNPIAHAARAVLSLEKPLSRFHPEVGYGVISVNMIKAGTHPSQVPGECVLLVDRRLLPGETKDTGLAEAEGDIREALKDFPEADFELAPALDQHGRLRYSAPNLTPWGSSIVQVLARAHEAVTGTAAEPFVDWFGATDSRCFRAEGIPTVSYGPGGQGAHGSNEYVEIPSLVTQYKVFVGTVLDLLT